jgi:hypothetical protein
MAGSHADALRGSQLPHAKLTEAKVAAIRIRNRMGVPRHKLAAEYGVHVRTIDRACTFENWVHVRETTR